MRKIIVIFLVSCLGLVAAGNTALADGMILPGLTSPDYLTVRYHHVTVNIEDNHAVTRVEQEFYNPNDFPITGQYVFPVPPEAILSSFTATVDGLMQTVTQQDAATTNTALFSNVAQRYDPSLLQYTDWETLAFDIELPAGGSRQMALEYEEVLAPSGGMYHYRYILSVERYSSQALEDVSISVDLYSSAGLSGVYSSSHIVATERSGANRARITWEAQGVLPTEDFDLFFVPADGGFGGGLLTGQRADYQHFLFMFAPDTEAMPDAGLPKDIVFVIDRSGSMGGEKIEQARNALHFILGQLNPNDRFSIVGFDDQLLVFSSTLQPVESETLDDARRFVDDLYANNDTNLELALQTGLGILERSETRSNASKVIIFLTDGLPTAGITDEGLIASLVDETNTGVGARLHVFGVGYDVNTLLLDRLADDNGGTVTYVQPGESLESVLVNFYSQIADPVLTDLEIEFDGMTVSDLYPEKLTDLFRGSSLLLTGRYHADSSSVTVRVSGRAGDERREYVYQYDLEQSSGHDFVPRLWATRRIGELLDRVRVEGESAPLINEIRKLGLGYGLVTPYTSFVVTAQTTGAASAENMALYQDTTQLNRVSGQTTVQARVQNQGYQQATQVDTARGGNVMNIGKNSLAQIGSQNVDLSIFQGLEVVDVTVTDEWLNENIAVDRYVEFASDEYFALAADPALRSYLQSGPNVIFIYNGEVIRVEVPEGTTGN